MTTTNFTGLTMPVFTAFGWAGEETALKFALSQLELFVQTLHESLPRNTRAELIAYGLSPESQNVYLAMNEEVESDAHIVFNARPASFEILMAITDKDVLTEGLKKAEKDTVNAHHLISRLGPEWTLRIQQMQIEEDTGVATHYQDLFKDSLSKFTPTTAHEVISKAHYLNSQEQWVTPIYLSRRFNAEQVAAMDTAVITVMNEQINTLMPVMLFLSGRSAKRKTSKRKTSKPQPKTITVSEADIVQEIDEDEGFVYISELKPLHLRRGFINLTPAHWPFFAINARTETRDISVYYDGIYDKKSAAWRLQPSDQARIVLGPAARLWLEETFAPNDKIQVVGRKLEDDVIQISLVPVTN